MSEVCGADVLAAALDLGEGVSSGRASSGWRPAISAITAFASVVLPDPSPGR